MSAPPHEQLTDNGTVATDATVGAPPDTTTLSSPVRASGRWIDHWDPEDAVFWRGGGRSVARRNLAFSVAAELLGFCVWALWSVVVPLLPGAGFHLTLNQQFWLIALPSLVGATLRIPYTFAVPRFGGRNWTVVSALLLLIPSAALAWVVTRPETSFGVLLGVRRAGRLRWRQLRLVDDQHLVLLPRGREGKGVGAQRRRRQPRHRRRAAGRSPRWSPSVPGRISTGLV